MKVSDVISDLRTRALTRHRSVRAWLKQAGVAESTYYRWLQGKTAPSTRTIARLELAAEG